MKIFQKELQFASTAQIELIDITENVKKIIIASKIKNGILQINSLHTTAAIVINENEKGLKKDFISAQQLLIQYKKLTKLIRHHCVRLNAAAHLSSGIIGSAKTIIIKNGEPVLGTWQSIFLYELDGPRKHRKVHLLAMGQ